MPTVVLVLVQVLIIIGISRLMGLGCRVIKQPLVIGEIIAGIMLGPSLLGSVAPELAITVFPVETLSFLDVLSQVGLIFFMFLIGLELDPKYLKGNLDIAILTSHVSILVPKTDAKTTTVTGEKPSLTGRLSDRQLNVSGSVPWVKSCNNSDGQADASGGTLSVRVQGIVTGENLSGQISLSSIPVPTEFTAQREAMVEQREKH